MDDGQVGGNIEDVGNFQVADNYLSVHVIHGMSSENQIRSQLSKDSSTSNIVS